ncbi:MAG: YopX family protein [Ktedonobacteraceae bacterium]
MRTLKFCVWNKHAKKMEAVQDLYWFEEQHIRDFSDDTQYEVLQFTGMQDRHGKDVYEGDILGLDDPEDHSRALVVFHQGAFKPQLLIRQRPKYSPIFDTGWDWTIIGNMYENPELLKTKGRT